MPRRSIFLHPIFSHLFLGLLCFNIAVMASYARPVLADGSNAFTAIRTGSVMVGDEPATRLVIEMAQPIDATLFLLDTPYRVVLDVAGADWDAGQLLPIGDLNQQGVKSYRYGRPNAETGRLVFEMSGPSAPVRAFILPPRDSGGHRLVIDVQDRGKTAFSVAQAALKKQPYIAELGDSGLGEVRTNAVQAAPTVQQAETVATGRVVSVSYTHLTLPTKRIV